MRFKQIKKQYIVKFVHNTNKLAEKMSESKIGPIDKELNDLLDSK